MVSVAPVAELHPSLIHLHQHERVRSQFQRVSPARFQRFHLDPWVHKSHAGLLCLPDLEAKLALALSVDAAEHEPRVTRKLDVDANGRGQRFGVEPERSPKDFALASMVTLSSAKVIRYRSQGVSPGGAGSCHTPSSSVVGTRGSCEESGRHENHVARISAKRAMAFLRIWA